jgi:hypothetical protein
MRTPDFVTDPVSDYVNVGTRDLVIKESDDIRSITVFGIKYSLELFRMFGTVDIGRCLQIVSRKDGVVTVRSLSVTDLGNGDFSFHVDPDG